MVTNLIFVDGLGYPGNVLYVMEKCTTLYVKY